MVPSGWKMRIFQGRSAAETHLFCCRHLPRYKKSAFRLIYKKCGKHLCSPVFSTEVQNFIFTVVFVWTIRNFLFKSAVEQKQPVCNQYLLRGKKQDFRRFKQNFENALVRWQTNALKTHFCKDALFEKFVAFKRSHVANWISTIFKRSLTPKILMIILRFIQSKWVWALDRNFPNCFCQ